jgi:predicted porin
MGDLSMLSLDSLRTRASSGFLPPLSLFGAAALALTLGEAQAQGANVEMFGRLDVGIAAFKGINSGTSTTVGSGLSQGSALGVRGEEDLGHGYKAVFTLEHGLAADTGGVGQSAPLSGNRVPAYATRGLPAEIEPIMQAALGDFLLDKIKQPFWGRQSFVGLITPVGGILAGRLYSPAYEIFDRYDPMESGNVADPYAMLAVPEALEVRTDRTLQYRMELNGWSGALSWAGASSEGLTPTGRFVGGFVSYEAPNFSAAIAHQVRQTSQGQSELSNTLVGAWWQIDAFKLMGSYTVARNKNPELGLSLISQTQEATGGDPDFMASAEAVSQQLRVDTRLWSFGVQYRPSPQWRLIANHAKLHEGKLAEGDVQLWGAAMEYSLSKRTSVWTAVSYIDNQADQQVAPITSGTFNGFANSPGQATSALQINLSHRF